MAIAARAQRERSRTTVTQQEAKVGTEVVPWAFVHSGHARASATHNMPEVLLLNRGFRKAGQVRTVYLFPPAMVPPLRRASNAEMSNSTIRLWGGGLSHPRVSGLCGIRPLPDMKKVVSPHF